MLRWMTPLLAAIFTAGTAAAESVGTARPADVPAAAAPAEPPAARPADPPPMAKPDVPPAATAMPAASPAGASPAGAKPAEKKASARRAAVHAARQLPPGLPRPYYKYRTTIAPGAAPPYVRRGRTVVVEEEVLDLPLISGGIEPYAPRIVGTPLLPGSSTLPGYYGTDHSYSYDGPYYGSPSYWNRLPYACGVYGYC